MSVDVASPGIWYVENIMMSDLEGILELIM